MDERRRRAAAAVAAIMGTFTQDGEDAVVTGLAQEADVAVFMDAGDDDRRGGVVGRRWEIERNDKEWFFQYALRPDFRDGPLWKASFRIPYATFVSIANRLRPMLTRTRTRYREPLPVELRVASFLMYAGGATCHAVGTQLGIGTSTVARSVSEVSRAVWKEYREEISFPTTEEEVANAMEGFQQIRGLPYCVGAVDGTHVPWPSCPLDQFYEYRCYKGFTSIVLFAVCTADRKFTYIDVGRPGVLGDSTIFQRSSLKRNIDDGKWLGSAIPDLNISDVTVRPYLIGDCAFSLQTYMMKTTSRREQQLNPVLKTWDSIAADTRKPIECAFGMLKARFPALKTGIKLHHEDDIVYFSLACATLHNMCIDDFDGSQELVCSEDVDDELVSAENAAARRQRDALLYFVLNEQLQGQQE